MGLPGHRAEIPSGDFRLRPDHRRSGPLEHRPASGVRRRDRVGGGRVRPNTARLPDEVLDEHGFPGRTRSARAGPGRRVRSATSPPPTRPLLGAEPGRPPAGPQRPRLARRRPARRVPAGPSTVGVDPGLPAQRARGVLHPEGGGVFRFPAWSIDTVLQPWIVRRGIYGRIARAAVVRHGRLSGPGAWSPTGPPVRSGQRGAAPPAEVPATSVSVDRIAVGWAPRSRRRACRFAYADRPSAPASRPHRRMTRTSGRRCQVKTHSDQGS